MHKSEILNLIEQLPKKPDLASCQKNMIWSNKILLKKIALTLNADLPVFSSEQNTNFKSKDTLAAEMSSTAREFSRKVAVLEDAGYLIVGERTCKNNGQTTNYYFLSPLIVLACDLKAAVLAKQDPTPILEKIAEIKSLQPIRRRAKAIGKLSREGRIRAKTKAQVIQLTQKIEEANLLGKSAAEMVREKRDLEGKILDISEKIKAAAKAHEEILDFDFPSFVESLASIAIPTRSLSNVKPSLKTRKEGSSKNAFSQTQGGHRVAKVANCGSGNHTHGEAFLGSTGSQIGNLEGAQKPSQFMILNPEIKPESNPLSLGTNTALKINNEFESERESNTQVFEEIFSRFAALPNTGKVNDYSKTNFKREFHRRQHQGKTSLNLVLNTLNFWESDYYVQQKTDDQKHSLGRLFADLEGIVAAKKRIIQKNLANNTNKIAAIHEFCEVRGFDVFQFSKWVWQDKAPSREDLQQFIAERNRKLDPANDNPWEAYLRQENASVTPMPEREIDFSAPKEVAGNTHEYIGEAQEETSGNTNEDIEVAQEVPTQLGELRLVPPVPSCDESPMSPEKSQEELRVELHKDKSIRAILMKIQLVCVKRSVEAKDDSWTNRYKNEIEPGIKNYHDAYEAYQALQNEVSR